MQGGTEAVERVFREQYGGLIASLVRRFGDIDIAEEAASEALVAALEKWPESGVPRSLTCPHARRRSSGLPRSPWPVAVRRRSGSSGHLIEGHPPRLEQRLALGRVLRIDVYWDAGRCPAAIVHRTLTGRGSTLPPSLRARGATSGARRCRSVIRQVLPPAVAGRR